MAEHCLSELHAKILEIAVAIDKLCRTHNISYYLMGGSALGAIRHGGFIPWDDDFDVFMTYDNYVRFIQVCRDHLDRDRFYLQEEDSDEWPLFFTKVRMNGTTFIEADTKYRKMHKGVYIDIMCLNNVSDNKTCRYLQYLAARVLTAATLGRRGYTSAGAAKKIGMFVARILVRGSLKGRLLMFVRSLNGSVTKDVGHFFGRAKYVNTCFPRDYLGTPRYVQFEGAWLPVPKQAEKYLTLRYGDFMAIPSESQRYAVHAETMDLNRDYSEFDLPPKLAK